MRVREDLLSCPSASEHLDGAQVFALIVDQHGPVRLGYLEPEAMQSLPAEVEHSRALLNRTNARFAAPCQEGKCGNFVDGRCGLSRKIVNLLPPVLDTLPKCAIRSTCRWFFEERAEACLRCPQVVTVSSSTDPSIGVPLGPPSGSVP
jgi:hypothetical protein